MEIPGHAKINTPSMIAINPEASAAFHACGNNFVVSISGLSACPT
jgi:hypothetical protein